LGVYILLDGNRGERLEEAADRERGITMAETEIRQPEYDKTGDLRDQIHGVRLEVRDQTHGVRLGIQEVRLEVEKVRSEMAKMDTGLSHRIGGVRLEVEKVRSEMTDQIGGLEKRMSEQIQGVEKGLRAWMAVGVSIIAVLVTLMSVLG